MPADTDADDKNPLWNKAAERSKIRRSRKDEMVVQQMNDYEILNIIGQGAFGNAYLARHKKQGQDYVIKKIELNGKNKQQIENIYNQVQLLQQFKHVNIVSYRQSIKEGQELNIVMEYCSGGDMNQLIVQQKENHGGRRIEEKKVLQWAAQIALAIFYMHDKRILHRDLKTPNIFILDKKVKLGDFGISKVLDQNQNLASTSIGTPYYMSPEQYRHRPYSYKSDMWAFGCILYQMCNQKRPFQALSLNGLAVKVLQANFAPISQYYGRQLRELICKTLQKKEKDRPSILQFLQTPIIKRKATAYLKQTYNSLLKEKGDQGMIDGVLYQAKKLGISLSEPQKKTKPQFSAEKRKQEREKTRQHLEDDLKKISQKTDQSKRILAKMSNERKKITPSQRVSSQHSNSSKSFKQQSTVSSEEKVVHAPAKFEQKPKKFQIKEKYDMYDMEFEDQGYSDEEPETIPEEEEEEEKEQKYEPKPYQKQKYTHPLPKQVKEVKPEPSKFSQLVPQENLSSVEEQIHNLKEQIRNNMEKFNTIQNQISNIDFSISSSDDDQLEKNIEPELMPAMKKKERNPVHVLLTDKANDLQQTLQNILPKNVIKELVSLARNKGNNVTRPELEKVMTSGKQGAYHLAFELVKLNSVLERIPTYA